MNTLRVLCAVLAIAYAAALFTTCRDKYGPLLFRAWLAFLVVYSAVYVASPGYLLSGVWAVLQVALQFGAAYEALIRVALLLGDQQRRAVVGYSFAAGVTVWGLALWAGAQPYSGMPRLYWYLRTLFALQECGMLAATLLYSWAKLGFAGREHLYHGTLVLAWIAAAAWGHAQQWAGPAIIVTAVHLTAAVGWAAGPRPAYSSTRAKCPPEGARSA